MFQTFDSSVYALEKSKLLQILEKDILIHYKDCQQLIIMSGKKERVGLAKKNFNKQKAQFNRISKSLNLYMEQVGFLPTNFLEDIPIFLLNKNLQIFCMLFGKMRFWIQYISIF